jgi:hypothetical protein
MAPIALHLKMGQNEEIKKWDKMRRSSANQCLQSVIGSHKEGHVKIPTEMIAHNNNVWTRNINQLWHTTGASVL